MGAVCNVDRLEAKLRDLRVRRGKVGSRHRPAPGWDALTETEEWVLDLIAGGLTYREVGERMFISRGTVRPTSPVSSPRWVSQPRRAQSRRTASGELDTRGVTSPRPYKSVAATEVSKALPLALFEKQHIFGGSTDEKDLDDGDHEPLKRVTIIVPRKGMANP